MHIAKLVPFYMQCVKSEVGVNCFFHTACLLACFITTLCMLYRDRWKDLMP